jgi:hypothetical protein
MLRLMLATALAFSMSGCTGTTEYQRRGVEEPLPPSFSVEALEQFDQTSEASRLDLEARSIERFDNPRFGVGIIEVDDRGLINPAQYQQVKSFVDDELKHANEAGSLLVTFVHGWHHNCATCDGNLACFRRLLSALQRREQQPNGLHRQVVGVYVAWRGRAFDGVVDYVSIWNRKWRAEDLGHRAGKEILNDLHSMWTKHKHNCLMVTIGHSLGGGFLLSAVRGRLTGDGGDAINGTGSRYRAVVRTQGSRAAATPGFKALRSRFGDVVVLINPAIEAQQYSVFDADLRGTAIASEAHAKYDQAQLPVLLVLSSTSDGPNRFLFPASRAIAAVDLLHHSDIWGRSSQVLALGHDARQLTHYLRYEGSPIYNSEEGKRVVNCGCDVDWRTVPARDSTTPSRRENTVAELVSGTTKAPFSDPSLRLTLTPERSCQTAACHPWDPHSPYMVIQADWFVIRGHDDIFNSRVVTFLADFLDAYTHDKQLRNQINSKDGY